MLVHAPLGNAGRPGRVGDHRDLVGPGVGGREARGLPIQQRLPCEIAGPGVSDHDEALERRRLRPGPVELLPEDVRHDRGPGPGILDDVGQLASAKERHRRDRDDAQLLACEPGDDELRTVGESEEDAVAPVDPRGAEAVREPVDAVLELTVGDDAVVVVDRRAARAVTLGVEVDQLVGRRSDGRDSGSRGGCRAAPARETSEEGRPRWRLASGVLPSPRRRHRRDHRTRQSHRKANAGRPTTFPATRSRVRR